MENGFSPYEQVKIMHMQSRRASGTAIAGLVLGVAGVVVGVGAGMYATAKATEARRVATAENDGTAAILNRLARQVEVEHGERVQGDINLTATINDTVSGSQQGQLTASQIAQQEQAQQVMLGLMTGKYSENPQKVAIYQDAKPCPCPGYGCGCQG